MRSLSVPPLTSGGKKRHFSRHWWFRLCETIGEGGFCMATEFDFLYVPFVSRLLCIICCTRTGRTGSSVGFASLIIPYSISGVVASDLSMNLYTDTSLSPHTLCRQIVFALDPGHAFS
jgi:hypothetical protein